MKINWGTGMAITLMAFMTFIIVLATKMSNIDTNLVEKDYYEKGQNFNAIYQMKANLKNEPNAVLTELKPPHFKVKFKEVADSGYVHFYRPSDRSLDFKIKLHLERELEVPLTGMTAGKWMVKIMYFSEGKGYLKEDSVVI